MIENQSMIEEENVEIQPAKPAGKTNYLSNKELLAEIHKSKVSYCSYVDFKYTAYDAIVASIADITPEFIEETRISKAAAMTAQGKAKMKEEGRKPAEIRTYEVDPQTIPTEDIVFRVMTSAHIPLDPKRKRRGKGENSNHTKTPFYPFKHFIIQNGNFVEVCRSHWRGPFDTGVFDMNKGQMTHKLAVMFIMLVDRYSRRANWRSYTYLDEMKSHALVQLTQIGLQFDEFKSDNPFAFYTTVLTHCFTRILNLEKKNQNIRDDILIMNGASPSNTRINDYEHARGVAAHNQLFGIVPTEPVKKTKAKKKVDEVETEETEIEELEIVDIETDISIDNPPVGEEDEELLIDFGTDSSEEE